eukprot:3098764-Rhodomonas_salina.2
MMMMSRKAEDQVSMMGDACKRSYVADGRCMHDIPVGMQLTGRWIWKQGGGKRGLEVSGGGKQGCEVEGMQRKGRSTERTKEGRAEGSVMKGMQRTGRVRGTEHVERDAE